MMNIVSLGFQKLKVSKNNRKNIGSTQSPRPIYFQLEVSQDLFGDWVVLTTKSSMKGRFKPISHAVVPQKRMAQEVVMTFLDQTFVSTKANEESHLQLDYHEDENIFSWVPAHFPIELLKMEHVSL